MTNAHVMESLASQRERFRRFVRTRVASDAEADDLLQQAWLRATERVSQLREPEHAEAWFYRMLRRAVADFRARKAREIKQFDQLATDVEAHEPEEIAACACALGLLQGQKAEYRELLSRVDLDDERVVDVAATLGLSANNATVRLHRARKSLRDAVLAHCGAPAKCDECQCD